MTGCDYCDEGLPLWHRREADEYGLEPDQFMPCTNHVDAQKLLSIIADMIGAGFSREDVNFVREACKGRLSE